MLHRTRLDLRTTDNPTARPPAGVVLQPPPTLAAQGGWFRRARLACQRWLLVLGAALERAERHITENFKVPPHGG